MVVLEVPATVAALDRVAAYALELAARAGLGERDRYRLRLIVDELVTNVATHAAAGPAPRPIRLTGSAAPGSVRLEISDHERPFDPVRHPAGEHSDQLGGFGLVLVRQAADGLEYRWSGDGNTTTVLVRHRPGGDR